MGLLKAFFTEFTILSSVNPLNPIPLNATLLSAAPLKCVSMNNQECKVRPEIVNVNIDEPVFYPFSIKTSKCSGSCNNINDPYAKICVPDVVKDLNVKVFNLMSRTNETRHIKWHETCKCKCRLDASVCNNKQRWNEWKELIDKGVCDKRFFGILVIVSVNVINHVILANLDYESSKYRKKLVDKLVAELTKYIDGVNFS